MKTFELIAPCHFGLESVLKREITDLGYDVTLVEDGRVTFTGDARAVCDANIFLRTAERVLIKVGSFKAETYDELFNGVYDIDWDEWLPVDAKFWVTKASTIKSKLFSPSDIQSIVKKAMVKKLAGTYNVSWFSESGEEYPVRIFLMKDQVTLGLDTTGDSLHKRGYRRLVAKAPISETLAAALLMLTPWHKDRVLVDPFCGSGTFPIEAAMMAANIAPGMARHFTAEKWTNIIDPEDWADAFEEAREQMTPDVETDIQGFDIDKDIVAAARENARCAGVDHLIHFQQRPVSALSHPKKYGFIVTNPPYGERIGDLETLAQTYKEFGERFNALDSWSAYMITSFADAEKCMGRKADKNRKIYNGMKKTYFYQFIGPKPPKRERKNEHE